MEWIVLFPSLRRAQYERRGLMNRFGLGVPVLMIGIFLQPAPAFVPPHGSDFTCTALTPATGAHENIVVPPGETCNVSAANVGGNIKALQDARLFVLDSQVGGSIYGEKADR